MAILAHDGKQSIPEVMQMTVADTQLWAGKICELRIARFAKKPGAEHLEDADG